MPAKRLGTPRLTVWRASDDEKALEVQTTNADLVLWDRTRIKHKWPKFDEAPFLWMTFLAWAACRRSGLIPPDTTYEAWEADVLEVSSDDDEETDQGFPTNAEAAPGSSLS